MREKTFSVRTSAREQILIITDAVQRALEGLTDGDGICTIVTPHTTCAISVNENADPDVPADLTKALHALIPDVKFRHGEGNSDAHFLSMLIGTSLSWPYKRKNWSSARGVHISISRRSARRRVGVSAELVCPFPTGVNLTPS